MPAATAQMPSSRDALARALWIAAVDRFPYTILDATGKQVAKGDAGAPPHRARAGTEHRGLLGRRRDADDRDRGHLLGAGELAGVHPR